MKRTVKIAFCGCGKIAEAHAQELEQIEGADLVAYADCSASKAEALFRKYGGTYWTTDNRRIAEDPGIDAIYLNTMHNNRLPLVEMFAENGKAVFSEKPLTHNTSSLQRLHLLLEKHNCLFWSGYKIRFHTLFEQAMNKLPAPEMISAHVYDEYWPDGYLHDPDIAGGNVLSQGVYAVESARLLAKSQPTAVTAIASYNRHRPDVADTLAASYEFANGTIASVIIGDAGLAPEGVSKFQVIAAGKNCCLTISDRFRKLSFRDSNTAEETVFEHEEDGFRRQSEAFLEAVRGNGPLIASFREGAIPSIMIYRALDAAISGKKEIIDIDKFLAITKK